MTKRAISVQTLYREHLALLVMDHASDHGALSTAQACSRIAEVSGCALSTAKNWFVYLTHSPDAEALARIVWHWQIPPDSVYPSEIGQLAEAERPRLTQRLPQQRRAKTLAHA